jgi:Bacterial transglutaminase-like cysteine proteinase BTLCP
MNSSDEGTRTLSGIGHSEPRRSLPQQLSNSGLPGSPWPSSWHPLLDSRNDLLPSILSASRGPGGVARYRGDSLSLKPSPRQPSWRTTPGQRIPREGPSFRGGPFPSRFAANPRPETARSQVVIEEPRSAANRFSNDWRYKADDQNYGRRDYWATPLEFLRHSGDCEDYAIVKYVSLRQLGFTPEQLRLVVVRDVVRDLAHAVLAVYLDGEVYILDNLTKAVLQQERISQYVPYYSINETTRWAHVPAANTLVSSRSERMTPSAEAD